MAHPLRCQRSRKKGARTPEGVKYVGRPTIFGNPFQVAAPRGPRRPRTFSHAMAVKLHRRWLEGRLGAMTLERLGFTSEEIDALTRWRTQLLTRLHKLDGQQLQCWCSLTAPCHADTLAERAPLYAEYERLAA